MTATAMETVRDLLAQGWPGSHPADEDRPVTAMAMVGDLLASDWRPDLHPRDRHGRWAHKGSIPGTPGPAAPRPAAFSADPVLGDRLAVLFRKGKYDNVRQPLADAVRAYHAGDPTAAQDHLAKAMVRAQENGQGPLAVSIAALRQDIGAKHGQAFRKPTPPPSMRDPATQPPAYARVAQGLAGELNRGHEAESGQTNAAAWRAELHPRGQGGKFARIPGGGDSSPALARLARRGLPMGPEAARSAAAKAKVAARVAAGMRSPTADLVAAGGHDAWSRWPVHDDPGWAFRLEPGTGFLQAAHTATPGAGWVRGGPDAEPLFRRAAVGHLVRQWAKTANDHDGRSLAIQEATRREFALDHTTPWDEPPDLAAWTARELREHGAVYQDFARAQYNNTQADLAAEGITALHLYRGLAWPAGATVPAEYRTAGPAHLELRPLSSWSHDPATAWEYASGAGPTQEGGAARGGVLEADIPAAQVLSYPQGGMGSINLGEFVTLGRPTEAQLTLTGAPAPAAAAAGAGAAAMDRNEDWLRTRGWDLPGVTDLGHLLTALDLDGQPEAAQRDGVAAFMALPAWQAAPAGLRAEAEQFAGGGHDR